MISLGESGFSICVERFMLSLTFTQSSGCLTSSVHPPFTIDFIDAFGLLEFLKAGMKFLTLSLSFYSKNALL